MTFAFANKMLCMCCLLQRYKLQSKFKPFVMYTPCRYRIEQELGTEIKPIPPIIEKDLYCSWATPTLAVSYTCLLWSCNMLNQKRHLLLLMHLSVGAESSDCVSKVDLGCALACNAAPLLLTWLFCLWVCFWWWWSTTVQQGSVAVLLLSRALRFRVAAACIISHRFFLSPVAEVKWFVCVWCVIV